MLELVKKDGFMRRHRMADRLRALANEIEVDDRESRRSLVQVLRETLQARECWVPAADASDSDIVLAVAIALDNPKK